MKRDSYRLADVTLARPTKSSAALTARVPTLETKPETPLFLQSREEASQTTVLITFAPPSPADRSTNSSEPYKVCRERRYGRCFGG